MDLYILNEDSFMAVSSGLMFPYYIKSFVIQRKRNFNNATVLIIKVLNF